MAMRFGTNETILLPHSFPKKPPQKGEGDKRLSTPAWVVTEINGKEYLH